ncbi:ABC transporter permease, partial [Anaerorhabdus sp.]|uniref:ABC transporter permease n=1 Tax=Anaerorhabdus sp. TaxID=1872524 RepID=UPI002FCAC69D
DGTQFEYKEPNIMIQTNIVPDSIEFVEGTNKIVDGRMYNQDDLDNANKVAVITKELADVNGLSVGDTIKLSSMQANQLPYYENMGITEDMTKLDWMSAYESPKNFILIPGTTIAQFNYAISKANYDYYVSQGQQDMAGTEPTLDNSYYASKVVYLLNDPLEVDAFVEDHKVDLKEYTFL